MENPEQESTSPRLRELPSINGAPTQNNQFQFVPTANSASSLPSLGSDLSISTSPLPNTIQNDIESNSREEMERQQFQDDHGLSLLLSPSFSTPVPGQIPAGRWSDGIFDCFESWEICLLSFFCTPFRWARSMERAHMLNYFLAITIYGLPWFLTLLFFLMYSWNAKLMWGCISIFFLVLFCFVGGFCRRKIRGKYQIPGPAIIDCCFHIWCACCAVAQEARHVDRDLGYAVI